MFNRRKDLKASGVGLNHFTDAVSHSKCTSH